MTKAGRRACQSIMLLALAGWLTLVAGADAPSPEADIKDVLILNSHSVGVPWADALNRAFNVAIRDLGISNIRLHIEYTGLSFHEDETYEKHLAGFYQHKYRDRQPFVVISLTSYASQFMKDYGKAMFPETSFHVCVGDDSELRRLCPDSIGVVVQIDLARNIEAVFRIHPKTRHIAVIADATEIGRADGRHIINRLSTLDRPASVIDLIGLAMDDLLQQVAGLPDESVILYMPTFVDGAGQRFIPREILPTLSQAANAPIYSFWETMLGAGIVGGYLSSPDVLARQLAELTRDILAGTPRDLIPNLQVANSAFRYDWVQLQRWGIDTRRLPEGSQIHNRRLSVWDLYGHWIALTFAVMAVLLVLVIALFLNRLRLKRIQAELEAVKLHLEDEVDARTASLNEARLEAQAALEENQQLMSILSHELRSPVAAISNATAVIDSALNKQQLALIPDMVQRIRHAIFRLKNFLDSLTAEDRLKKLGRRQAKQVVLHDHVQSLLAQLQQTHPESRCVWRLSGQASVTLQDPVMFNIVLNNLLDNAIKYSGGTQPVELSICVDERGGIVMEVADRGPGIDAELRKQLFRKYTRGKQAEYVSGTGIGLYLVKHILELLNGRIDVLDRDGGGACFRVELPPLISE